MHAAARGFFFFFWLQLDFGGGGCCAIHMLYIHFYGFVIFHKKTIVKLQLEMTSTSTRRPTVASLPKSRKQFCTKFANSIQLKTKVEVESVDTELDLQTPLATSCSSALLCGCVPACCSKNGAVLLLPHCAPLWQQGGARSHTRPGQRGQDHGAVHDAKPESSDSNDAHNRV